MNTTNPFLSRLPAIAATLALVLSLAETRIFALTTGDVAIVRVNANDDGFSVLTLRDLSASDSLYWTDNGWTNGVFRSGEGAGTTDILINNITAGTVFDVSAGSLANNGESAVLFSGTRANPTLLFYGVDWGNALGWDAQAIDAGTSGLPSILAGTPPLNISLGNKPTWIYTNSTAGTRAQILWALNNANNWATNTSPGAAVTNWTGGSFTFFAGYSNLAAGATLSNFTAVSESGKLTSMAILNSNPLATNSAVTANFSPTNALGFNSDLLHFNGTGTNTFVLLMNYDPTGLTLTQEQKVYIGWLDTNLNRWVNAVLGNIGETSNFVLGAWNASYGLGTYGVDTSSDSVWAVLNHNNDFAAIPEPGVAGLFGLGVLGFVLISRQRQSRC